MNLTFLKKVAPFAATVVATACPAAAPLVTIAAKVFSSGLGKTIAPTGSAIADAITTAMATPEDAAKIKQLDDQFSLQLQAFGVQRLEDLEHWLADMEASDAADRANARNREIQLAQGGHVDRTPEYGFYALIVLEAIVIGALFRIPIPQENKAIVFSAVGSIGTMLTAAGAYFWGANRSSQRATELLAQAPSINGNGGSK